MGSFKAEKIENRFGRKLYRCPICGHVFVKSKQYTKHIEKRHINKGFKTKRAKKKLEKYTRVVKEKLKGNKPLTKFERIIATKIKLFRL